MRIVFTRFPLESALGGAEIQTLSLMEGLTGRGHAVSFVGSCPTLLRECRKRNIPVTELDIGKPPVTKWEAIGFAWRKRKMKERLVALLNGFTDATGREPQAANKQSPEARGQRLDAICMLSLSEKLLLTDKAVKEGAKVFWIEHDAVGRWLTSNPWLPTLLEQSKKATTITVSELSRNIYVNLGWDSQKVIAIPNGIDQARFHGVETPCHGVSTNNGTRLGCIARLSKEKGIDVLIDAMKDVPENVTLEIVGKGPKESALKAQAQQITRHESRITFSDYEPNVSTVFKRIDALVLPSRENDPFGMVAAEAMFLSVPVIVTNQCGIADYLEDGTDALIAKAGSAESLEEKITLLTTNYSLLTRIAQAGQKTAQKKFSIKTMVDSYEHVFTGTSPASP